MPRKPRELTDEQIAQRAYEISLSPECGSDEENWHRAEQELRGGGDPAPKAPRKAPAAKKKNTAA